jgi:hypothetical protein
MVTDMRITPALTERVRAAVDATGWTWKEVQDHGGPSSTTMTDVVGGRHDKPISAQTCRKLDTAFGWPIGTARALCDPDYQPPTVTSAPAWVVGQSVTLTEGERSAIEAAFERAQRAAADQAEALSEVARILGRGN